MDLEQRIKAFAMLGEKLRNLSEDDFQSWFIESKRSNAWFTEAIIRTALHGLTIYLQEVELRRWVSEYNIPSQAKPKRVGVVMAGNIPLVGFHDFLCVLISGNTIAAKLSSNDNVLIKKVTQLLISVEPEFENRISFVDKLSEADAVIATGSDNSARYFHYYFSKIPHIIRQNRVSCAALTGNESKEELASLGKDILLYYGMGCRNVSKIYIPEGFDLTKLLDAIESHRALVDINKYYNNYDYNKSIFIVNHTPYLDNGFLLVTENTALASPVSVLYFEHYKSEAALSLKLESQKDKIQTVVSSKAWYPGSVEMGQAQFPGVNDYADGVDTLEFLINLSTKKEALPK